MTTRRLYNVSWPWVFGGIGVALVLPLILFSQAGWTVPLLFGGTIGMTLFAAISKMMAPKSEFWLIPTGVSILLGVGGVEKAVGIAGSPALLLSIGVGTLFSVVIGMMLWSQRNHQEEETRLVVEQSALARKEEELEDLRRQLTTSKRETRLALIEAQQLQLTLDNLYARCEQVEEHPDYIVVNIYK